MVRSLSNFCLALGAMAMAPMDLCRAQARTVLAETGAFVDVAVSDSTMYVSYAQHSGNVFLARSHDHGQTWFGTSPGIAVPWRATSTRVVADGDRVYSMFRLAEFLPLCGCDYLHLFVSTSDDRGATWSPPVRLEDGAFQGETTVATSQGMVVAVHQFSSIAVSASTDGFTTTTRSIAHILSAPFWSLRLATDGSDIDLVWREGDDVYTRRSTDHAATWSAPRRVNTDTTAGFSTELAVSTDGSTVVVAWEAAGDVWLNVSSDGGATWGSTPRLLDAAGSVGEYPAVATSGSTVLAAWVDDRSGPREVYAVRSTDGGATWGSDECLGAAGNSNEVRVDAAGGAFYAAWDRGNAARWSFNRSTDGGATWLSSPIRAGSLEHPYRVKLAASDELVALAWPEAGVAHAAIPAGVLTNYGDGSPGTGGLAPRLHAGASSGILGTATSFEITDGLGGANAVMFVGHQPTSRIDLSFGGLRFLVAPLAVVMLAPLGGAGPGAGTGSYSLPAWSDPVFLGQHFNVQAAVADPAGALGAALSNGVTLVIG